MANKGSKRHIKKLAASKYMKISRKTSKYIAKPLPGRHTMKSSIALLTVLKEKLNAVSSSPEAKRAIRSGNIEVNGKVVRKEKYPIGLGDIIHIKPSAEHYKIGVGPEGAFHIEKASEKEQQLFKVIGKYVVKGNKEMIRLHDGRIISAAKDAKVNDSIVLKGAKIEKIINMGKGKHCLVIKGTHASEKGKISEVTPGTATRPTLVKIDTGKNAFETILDNIMVIDE